jgi:hypothetical protein
MVTFFTNTPVNVVTKILRNKLEGTHIESESHYGDTGMLTEDLHITRWILSSTKRRYEMAKGSSFPSSQKHDYEPLPGTGSPQDQTQSSHIAHIY